MKHVRWARLRESFLQDVVGVHIPDEQLYAGIASIQGGNARTVNAKKADIFRLKQPTQMAADEP